MLPRSVKNKKSIYRYSPTIVRDLNMISSSKLRQLPRIKWIKDRRTNHLNEGQLQMTYSFEKGFETKVIMVVYLGTGMWPARSRDSIGQWPWERWRIVRLCGPRVTTEFQTCTVIWEKPCSVLISPKMARLIIARRLTPSTSRESLRIRLITAYVVYSSIVPFFQLELYCNIVTKA